MSAVVPFHHRDLRFRPLRRRLDIFGVLVLAVATGVAGGLLRDMALGAVPPEVLVSAWPIAVASLAGLCVASSNP